MFVVRNSEGTTLEVIRVIMEPLLVSSSTMSEATTINPTPSVASLVTTRSLGSHMVSSRKDILEMETSLTMQVITALVLKQVKPKE